MHVLVVEDESKIAEALAQGLSSSGHEVVVAPSAESALRRLETSSFEFVILDLGLPDQDGIEVLQTIRRRNSDVRVLILTARDHPGARVLGLDAGADDYLVKPFEFAELEARIRAIERRSETQPAARLDVGDLAMDLVSRTVTCRGVGVELTNREFQILECLVNHSPRPVSRGALVREVWKGMERATPIDNVIDVHIARLRRKLRESSGASPIRTIRGVGFCLEPGPS